MRNRGNPDTVGQFDVEDHEGKSLDEILPETAAFVWRPHIWALLNLDDCLLDLRL
jgi:hypothetical protein